MGAIIIPHPVHNDGVAPGLTGEKPAGPHSAPGLAVFRQQHRKIPQMFGMELAGQTPVGPGPVKWLLSRTAVVALVQVYAEESVPGQTLHLGYHNGPPGRRVEEYLPRRFS